jgi:hypothetical protein
MCGTLANGEPPTSKPSQYKLLSRPIPFMNVLVGKVMQ